MILGAQIVISNITVAGLVGGLAWLVGRSGRRATLAHALWVLFFVKLITPPLLWVPIAVPAAWLPPTVSQAVMAPSHVPSRAAAQTPPTDDGTPPPTVAPAMNGGAMDGQAMNGRAMDGGAMNGGDMDGQAMNGRAMDGGSGTPLADPASGGSLADVGLGAVVVAVWLIGFGVIFARGVIRFTRFRRLLLREGQPDQQARKFVRGLLRCEQGTSLLGKGGACGPEVLRLPVRVSPMLFGFGRHPVIVCPDQLWQSLSEYERHAFLAHETAHYVRRDHWVRWLEWFATALYWWFPGVYFARRELERHEEAACDAWAVRRLHSTPRQYGEALLRVVDFLSDYRVNVPRLASAMQPTDSLEQRLRLLMRPEGLSEMSPPAKWSAGTACVLLWIVHPTLQPESAVRRVSAGPIVAAERATGITTTADLLLHASPASIGSDASTSELPAPPRGFWNQRPRRQWARFSLTLPGARLIAEASRGITIERPARDPLVFSCDQLSAIVEIPSTRRVVIGDSSGRLRLWDLEAGLPTSLIGRHGAPVTSLTYHESFGLVSGDAAGSVMRWDLQSGQVLATWSGTSGAVQSLRRSGDDQTIAVLLGNWSQVGRVQEVHFVTAGSLASEQSTSVPSSTAVVMHDEPIGWITVDWSGKVRPLNRQQPITTIAKQDVSALVLSSSATIPWLSRERSDDAAF